MPHWIILIRDHHRAYVPWTTFEHNQEQLNRNNYGRRAGKARPPRRGQILLGGLLLCRRCGRRLAVIYGGRGVRQPRYLRTLGKFRQGLPRCIGFGARRPCRVVAADE